MDEINEFLQGFLPRRDDPLRPLILQDLVAVDLQKRWQQKNCILLEDYQRVIAGCENPDSWSAQLILEEWQTRIRHGDRIVIDEYRQRFPR